MKNGWIRERRAGCQWWVRYSDGHRLNWSVQRREESHGRWTIRHAGNLAVHDWSTAKATMEWCEAGKPVVFRNGDDYKQILPF